MKYFACILLLLCSSPAFCLRAIVILPLSNESEQQQLYWLGEGFAESLSEDLLLKDAYIIQRQERKAAYDNLRLPYTGDLSRATMRKVGENLAADYLVFGSYDLDEAKLTARAQVMKLKYPELSSPVEANGSLENLYEIQKKLRDGLKQYFATESIFSLQQKEIEGPAVPLHAYESYIKGLLETSDREKIRFFQRAMQTSPGYPQATYRMGLALFRLQQYKESNDVLQQISANGMFQHRTDFLMGLNFYFAGDLNSAYEKWLGLSQRSLTPEVQNNLGMVLLKKNDVKQATGLLVEALRGDPDNENYHFNLAACYLLNEKDAESIHHLREASQLVPADYQVLYLLGKLLEKQQMLQAKRVLEYFRKALPSDQKGKFPESYSTVLQLVRPVMAYLSAEERAYMIQARVKELKRRSEYVTTYQSNAKKELEDDETDNAILEIKKGLKLAPFDWYLYYLWGLASVEKEDPATAIPLLEFSIWCIDNIDSRILLAEIYREGEKYAEAKLQIQQILALDPENRKAKEIWGKIWNKN